MLAKVTQHKKLFMVLMVLLMLFVAVAPTFAQTETPTLNVDTSLFINEINNWLPMALTIAGIGVGIAGAFALALFVGSMITNALQGRGFGARR